MAIAVIGRTLVLGAVLLSAGAVPAAAAQSPLEYEVKAQYLGHFTGFIEWPPSAFPSADAPFRICVFGPNPFGAALGQLTGHKAAGRAITVETVKDVKSAASCQVVFLSGRDESRADALDRATRGRPVLIVSDAIGMLEHCAAIAFVLEGGFVRFDVNLTSLSARGLQVNPRLLRVARDATDRYRHCD